MYGLKRLLEIKKEREERKKIREKEKERKRKEKEREKKKLAKERAKEREKKKEKTHKRYLKRKRDANKKKTVAKIKARLSAGDVKGSYIIMVVKNRARLGRIGYKRWKSDAYQLYYDSIEHNKQDVKIPIRYVVKNQGGNRTNNKKSVSYEILLLKSIGPNDDAQSKVKNDDGKYVDVESVTWDNRRRFVILERNDWRVRETYWFYGYHPVRDRKDYEFIYEQTIRDYIENKKTHRSVLVYKNKLIVKYLDDFDFVVCKTMDDAIEMYNVMMKDVKTDKIKYVHFLGIIKNQTKVAEWIERIQEKTGWDTALIRRPYTL